MPHLNSKNNEINEQSPQRSQSNRHMLELELPTIYEENEDTVNNHQNRVKRNTNPPMVKPEQQFNADDTQQNNCNRTFTASDSTKNLLFGPLTQTKRPLTHVCTHFDRTLSKEMFKNVPDTYFDIINRLQNITIRFHKQLTDCFTSNLPISSKNCFFLVDSSNDLNLSANLDAYMEKLRHLLEILNSIPGENSRYLFDDLRSFIKPQKYFLAYINELSRLKLNHLKFKTIKEDTWDEHTLVYNIKILELKYNQFYLTYIKDFKTIISELPIPPRNNLLKILHMKQNILDSLNNLISSTSDYIRNLNMCHVVDSDQAKTSNTSVTPKKVNSTTDTLINTENSATTETVPSIMSLENSSTIGVYDYTSTQATSPNHVIASTFSPTGHFEPNNTNDYFKKAHTLNPSSLVPIYSTETAYLNATKDLSTDELSTTGNTSKTLLTSEEPILTGSTPNTEDSMMTQSTLLTIKSDELSTIPSTTPEIPMNYSGVYIVDDFSTIPFFNSTTGLYYDKNSSGITANQNSTNLAMNSTIIVILVSCGFLALLALFLCFLVFCCKKSKKKRTYNVADIQLDEVTD